MVTKESSLYNLGALYFYSMLPELGLANLGELANRPLETRVNAVNDLLAQHHAIHGETLDELYNREATKLRQGIADFRALNVDTRAARLAREEVASKIQKADRASQGLDMSHRVAARFAEFDGNIQTAFDVDNTITTSGTYLEATIPGSVLAEPMLQERGRQDFPEVFVRTWRHVLAEDKGADILYEGGRSHHVQIRKGVDNLFTHLRNEGIPRKILSANFKPFVDGVLSKTVLGSDPDLQIYTNTVNDISPTDKGAYLQAFAQSDTSRALIYVGDGSSDIPALEARNVVACYFALAGSEFAKALEEEHIPYFSYRDFDEIQLQLVKLQTLATKKQQDSQGYPFASISA